MADLTQMTDVDRLLDYKKDANAAALGYFVASMQSNDNRVRALMFKLAIGARKTEENFAKAVIELGGNP